MAILFDCLFRLERCDDVMDNIRDCFCGMDFSCHGLASMLVVGWEILVIGWSSLVMEWPASVMEWRS